MREEIKGIAKVFKTNSTEMEIKFPIKMFYQVEL